MDSRRMQFGFMLAGQFLSDGDPQAGVRDALEQVRLAREAGFDSMWMSQHFVADFKFLQTVPFLARLIAESGDMHVGTAVLLATFYHPVLLAEELATLDVISGGRLILGAGSGYREAEFRAFGLKRDASIERFDEVIDVVRKLWSGARVTYQGNQVALDNVGLRLLPTQLGKLPVWIGANGPKGVRRAATIGDEWLVSPELTLDVIAERQDVYRKSLPNGVNAEAKIYPVLREAYVAEDRETAVRIAGDALRRKYETYAKWGYGVGTVDDLIAKTFILGSVEECVAQIRRYQDELGSRYIIMRMQWPGLEHRDVLQSIERCGDLIASCRS